MSRVVITFLILVICGTQVHSQNISWQNTYRPNDRLIGKQIAFPEFSTTGPALVWDVSQCDDISDENYVVEYLNCGHDLDVLTAAIEQGTRFVYRLQGDSLLTMGYENRTSVVNYDIPEVWLKFPMSYGDSIRGYFHGTGRYCDKLGLRHYGRYNTKVDGIGCMILPEGDTLRNVVRLHTERTMSVEMTAIELLDSLYAYTPDSINYYLISDTALIRMDICRWYANGYRYPILETRQRLDRSGEHILSSQAYYYPPSEQATLSNDPANELIRSFTRGNGTYQQGENDSNSQRQATSHLSRGNAWNHNTIKPRIGHSADGLEVLLNYHVSQESTVSYRLYTLEGVLLKELQPQTLDAGFYTDHIPLDGYAFGVYILDFQIDNDRITEKVILK